MAPALTLLRPAMLVDEGALAVFVGAVRGDFQPFVAFLAAHGIASLVYDKRGIGESGGSYPGELATATTIDVLARDAAAAARFLAGQREIDATRVGLLGDSQGGWIISLAASHEPAVRWGLQLVGPTVTVDESDTWGRLAGQGATAPAGTFAELEQRVRAEGPGQHLGNISPFLGTSAYRFGALKCAYWQERAGQRGMRRDARVQRLRVS